MSSKLIIVLTAFYVEREGVRRIVMAGWGVG